MTTPFMGSLKRPSKSDEKRDRILRSALKIAIDRGIYDVTLTQVAKSAKLSKSHVAYYFPKQSQILEALFLVCAHQGQEETIQLVSQAKSPLEQLDAMVMGAAQWAKKFPEFARFFILIYHHATVSTSTAKQHSSVLEIGRSRIESILKQLDAQDTGKRSSVAARAKLIQQLLIGALIRAVSLNEIETFELEMPDLILGVRALAVTSS